MPADDIEGAARRGPVRRFAVRYWVALLLAALAAIFIAQNRDRVNIHILWITVAAPMWFVLTSLILIGMLVGLLLHRRRRS